MADLSLIPEAAWREAQRRAEIVRLLVVRDCQPRHLVRAVAVRAAAKVLRCHHATLYRALDGAPALR